MRGKNKNLKSLDVVEAYKKHGSFRAAGRALGIDKKTVAYHISKYADLDEVPDRERSVSEIIEARRVVYGRRKAHEDAAALIGVRLQTNEPIGIAHFGDPHLDDDGTNLDEIAEHCRVVRETEGMWGASVGDHANNWVGRLGRLYAGQTTTEREGWRLVEWFVQSAPWLYLVGGNHDAWTGGADPLRYIAEARNAHLQYDGARLALRFPSKREIRVNCRHDFKGHSQWNDAHGPMKSARFGFRDHILTCGHRHTNAYGIVPSYTTNGEPIVSHCIRVAAYKRFDDYAHQIGALDAPKSPCVVTIIDPADANPYTCVQVVWDVHEAAELLKWKRARHAKTAA